MRIDRASVHTAPMPTWSLCCLAGLLCASTACSKTIDDRGSAQVDFTNPKLVVSSIFHAASTGESGHLASLCDPGGEANKHVLRICAQHQGDADWPSFVHQFEKGRLSGEARIAGERAQVNFVFGADGSDAETMELVQRDGRWYLMAF